MGARHNRKRTRHRPRPRTRTQATVCDMRSGLPPSSMFLPTAMHPLPRCVGSTYNITQMNQPQPIIKRQAYSTNSSASSLSPTHLFRSPSRQYSSLYRPEPKCTMARKCGEDATSRDRRIFGEVAADETMDVIVDEQLRGRMLDVVLGLFDGLDYEDEEWQ